MSKFTTYNEAMNRLCKWRSILVGWMIGSKGGDEPGVQGFRDLVDRTMILRPEVTALTALLLKKGVFTQQEYEFQIVEECAHQQRLFEDLFKGMHAENFGVIIHDPEEAKKTMQRLGFPS